MGSDFKKDMDKLRGSFPRALDFLKNVYHNSEGFWLSAPVNAHLYYFDSFIAHITLQYSSVIFKKQPHLRVVDGTVIRNRTLFSKVFQETIVDGKLGRLFSWCTSDCTLENGNIIAVSEVTVLKSAPDDFFDRLLGEIKVEHDR